MSFLVADLFRYFKLRSNFMRLGWAMLVMVLFVGFFVGGDTYAADPSDSVTANIDINVLGTGAELTPGNPGGPEAPKTGWFTGIFGDGGKVVPVVILVTVALVVIGFVIYIVRRSRRPRLCSPLKKKAWLAVRVFVVVAVLGGVGVIVMLPRGETRAADGEKLVKLSMAEWPGVVNVMEGEELSETVMLEVSIETASQNDLNLAVMAKAGDSGIEIGVNEMTNLPAGTTSTTVPVEIRVPSGMAVGKYTEPIELTVNIEEGFWRASGRDVVDRYGMVTVLKGMNFETAGAPWYDTDLPQPELFMVTHTEFVYAELESLGINAIRLDFPARMLFDSCTTPACLTYDHVEEYFAIFDQMLDVASRHGVGIIFNVHNSFGNSYPYSGGDGTSFKWNIFLPENMEKTTELWRKVATRFADDKRVLGFDIVNEPFVRLEDGETPDDGIVKWDTVAQNMINEIRKIDENHMIIVEKATTSIRNGNVLTAFRSDYVFPDVSDPMENLMLEFHLYGISGFAGSSDRIEKATWVWGDPEKIVQVPGVRIATDEDWPPAQYKSNTDAQGEWVTIANAVAPKNVPAADPGWNYGSIGIQAWGTQTGMTVYVDEIKVDQYDANGVFEKTVHEETFRYNPVFDRNSPDSSATETDAARCYDDEGTCVKVFGPPAVAGSQVLFYRTTGDRFFPIDSTKKYQVTAKVYGENLSPGVEVWVTLTHHYGDETQMMPTGKPLLSAMLQKFVNVSKERNVPIFNGEWGILRFGDDIWEKFNGGQFAEDYLGAMRENKVNSAYFSYAKSVLWPNLDINGYYGMRVKPDGVAYGEPFGGDNSVLNNVLYGAFLNDRNRYEN